MVIELPTDSTADESTQDLVEVMAINKFCVGEELVIEGAPATVMYFILDGKVREALMVMLWHMHHAHLCEKSWWERMSWGLCMMSDSLRIVLSVHDFNINMSRTQGI